MRVEETKNPDVQAPQTSGSLRDVKLLQIEPTTKCNFTCGFCCGRKMDQSDISMETYTQALNLFPNLERVELHGEGEPMSHPEIFDMIHEAHKRGLKTSSITNGSMFSPERIGKILDSGIETLFVSIESPRVDEFKEIRGGNLDKVKAGIRAFLQTRNDRGQNNPTLGLAVTVLKRTQTLMREIADLYKELGMDGGISTHMLNAMKGYTDSYSEEMSGQVLSKTEQALAWVRYSKIIESPEYDRGAVHFLDEMFGQTDPQGRCSSVKNRLARDYRSCTWLDQGMYVNRHGKATGCARIKDTDLYSLGDVNHDSADAIIDRRNRMGDELRGGAVPTECEGCFIAESIESRISNISGKMPLQLANEVTPEEWDSTATSNVIGSVPFDKEAVGSTLELCDGNRSSDEIVALLSETWEIDKNECRIRVFPILNELHRMNAISL